MLDRLLVCEVNSRSGRGNLLIVAFSAISLLVNDKLGDLLHLGHEARLAVIEVVVKQTQVLHVIFLHRVEHLSLTDLNPDLVLGSSAAAN